MTGPILLVGEVNPYSTAARHALWDEPHGASGDRLRRLVLGLRRSTYRSSLFSRHDLCVGSWSLREARETVSELAQQARTTVLLGRKVARAYFCDNEPAFSIVDDRLVLLPHPSGLCRAWHEPGAFERARNLLRSVRPDVPWGELVDDNVVRLQAAREG